MRFKIIPTQPGNPPAPPEPVLLFELKYHGKGIAVAAWPEGGSSMVRYILTIDENGLWRPGYTGGIGLPTDEIGRIVDCTGGK